MKLIFIITALIMTIAVDVNAQMSFDSASYIENNQGLMGVLWLAAVLFFYGLCKQSFFLCSIAVIGAGLNFLLTSMYLHLYCVLTGTDIKSIESYNYAALASLATILLIAVLVDHLYEKYHSRKNAYSDNRGADQISDK
jgi:hypothetical protein